MSVNDAALVIPDKLNMILGVKARRAVCITPNAWFSVVVSVIEAAIVARKFNVAVRVDAKAIDAASMMPKAWLATGVRVRYTELVKPARL